MVAQPIPVGPGQFRAEREESAPVVELLGRPRGSGESVVARSPGAGGRTGYSTEGLRAASRVPSQCLLTVEGGGERVSLVVPLRLVGVEQGDVYVLETPATLEGLYLAVRLDVSGEGGIRLRSGYAGLDSSRALEYARFLDALTRPEGSFTVSVYRDGKPFHIATMVLPLGFDEAERERFRLERLFWEGVREASAKTGTRLVCPQEITDADLRNLNVVLGAVRNGWVAERVGTFTIPSTQETAGNLLRAVEEEGPVFRSLVLFTEHEPIEVFGTPIDLGAFARHFARARVLTPPEEIRAWILSGQGGALSTRWEPADGAHMSLLFYDWPKREDDPAGDDGLFSDVLGRKGRAPLELDESGTVRVSGTRVSLDSVAVALGAGETSGEIAERYPSLDKEGLDQVAAWYLRYQKEVRGLYLAPRELEAEFLRRDLEARYDTRGLRRRLLARAAGIAEDGSGAAPDGPEGRRT